MRYIVIAVLALVLGGLAGRAIWKKNEPEPVDPIQIIVTQVKTHAVIEHERQIAVWYRACPNVIGVTPEIFVAWPAKLSYQLELSDVAIQRSGDTITVRTRAIHADEPAVPTDFIDYLSTKSIFTFANEEQLVNREVAKSSALARYLSAYFLRRDESLRGDFAAELESLVRRLAGALGVNVARIDVDIERQDVVLPKLPAIELCAGSFASVNGLPFAQLQDHYTLPIGFKPPPSARSRASTPQTGVTVPAGIASVYGRAPHAK